MALGRKDPNKITYERWLYWRELVDVARCYLGWNRLSKAIGSPNAGYVQKAYEYRNVAQDDDIPLLEDLVGGALNADGRIDWGVGREPVFCAVGAPKPHKYLGALPLDDRRRIARRMLELAKAATGNDNATETEEMSNRNHGRACDEAEAAEFRALAHALVTHFNYTPMRLAIACGYHENSTANLRRAMEDGGVPSITKLEAVRAHYRKDLGQDPADVLLMLAAEPKGRPAPGAPSEVVVAREGNVEQVRVVEPDGHVTHIHRVSDAGRAALAAGRPVEHVITARPEGGIHKAVVEKYVIVGRREGESTLAWLVRTGLAAMDTVALPLPQRRELGAAVDAGLAEIEAARKAPDGAPIPEPGGPDMHPMEAARAALWSAAEYLAGARGCPPELAGLPPYARDAVRLSHEAACDDAAERVTTILTTLE